MGDQVLPQADSDQESSERSVRQSVIIGGVEADDREYVGVNLANWDSRVPHHAIG